LLVAGLSNEEFSSKLRRIPFPFPGNGDSVIDNNLEIFHVSHGKWETAGPDPGVRPVRRRPQHPGQLHLHAGRALPAGRPDAGHQDRGPHRRRARRDEPALDVVAFTQDGQEYVLVANTSHVAVTTRSASLLPPARQGFWRRSFRSEVHASIRQKIRP
jgi:hypothetical protein